ncbi:MAG: SDR family oxidoreductase [Deltaproteobacteria bacterium]|nr:SDR family oxidoreductase [Deltaproteobacteria bacterium]
MKLAIDGTRAVITAGASGICRDVAELFVKHGANVFIGDIDEDKLSGFLDKNKTVSGIPCDVSKSDKVAHFILEAQRRLGGIDILINGAGIGGPAGKVEDIEPREWDRTLAVGINGAFYCTKYAVPHIKSAGGGSIINFSSAAGIMGYPYRSPYAASKWAIEGFTKTLAMELGEDNIRVNAIVPGLVEGERMERVIGNEAMAKRISTEEVRASFIKGISMQKFVTASDVANMILFLCSDAGRYISGQSIGIDGYTEILR